MPIIIDEIFEKNQERKHELKLDVLEELNKYELWDLTDDEILNNPAVEILLRDRRFLQGFAEWERNSTQIGEVEPEYEFVRKLIERFPEAIR